MRTRAFFAGCLGVGVRRGGRKCMPVGVYVCAILGVGVGIKSCASWVFRVHSLPIAFGSFQLGLHGHNEGRPSAGLLSRSAFFCCQKITLP